MTLTPTELANADVMQLEDFTDGWVPFHVGLEGDALSIEGVNPWFHKWRQISLEAIVVPHPSYRSERHRAWVYEIEGSRKTVRFAAAELSNGVWGFYVPATPAA